MVWRTFGVCDNQLECAICNECERSFQYPKDLEKHLTSHTGERAFTCICGRSYGRKDNLLRHQQGNNTTKACEDFLQATLN